jgi:integrase/recombinase XerD
LLLLAVQTGLRLSELIGLDRDAIHLGAGAHVRCVGKGRKERCTPLTTLARDTLKAWLKEPIRYEAKPLFPNVHGGRLSADSVQALLSKYVRVASENCPSLASKRVSPHVLRHSAAMELLQAGVDCSVIALWLGHEAIETTQTYDLSARSPCTQGGGPGEAQAVQARQANAFPAERPPARIP